MVHVCHNIYESVTTYIQSMLYIKQLKLFTTQNVRYRCEPFHHVDPIVFQFQLVARSLLAYPAKKMTESPLLTFVYMTRKHVHVIEKRSLYSQNVFCYFSITLVYHIAENFQFFLHLVEVIWKTAANKEKLLYSLLQKNMRGSLRFIA